MTAKLTWHLPLAVTRLPMDTAAEGPCATKDELLAVVGGLSVDRLERTGRRASDHGHLLRNLETGEYLYVMHEAARLRPWLTRDELNNAG